MGLRIQVQEANLFSTLSEPSREVNSSGRFADATFLIEYSNFTHRQMFSFTG